MAIYILYAFYIWLVDTFDLGFYLVNFSHKKGNIISYVLAAIFILVITLHTKKYFTIQKEHFSPFFVLSATTIFIFGFIKAIMPDTSADVLGYHLLVQDPGFSSATTDNLMPGHFQMYGFRWGDRLFFAFRHILGYRMGTLFNSIIMILIYGQICHILHLIYGNTLVNIRDTIKQKFHQSFFPGMLFHESVIAFGLVFIHDVLLQSGSYMIDLLAIPFFLEALTVLLYNADKTQSMHEMVWFTLMSGCFFAFKMTHIIYIVPLIVIYIVQHKTEITPRHIICCFCSGVFPVLIYLLYAYHDTGNPIFPYFNKFFQSIWFNASNFKDTRWGPSNILETFFWPFISAFRPKYRLSEISDPYAIGIIFLTILWSIRLILSLFKKWKRHYSSTSYVLLILTTTTYYLWSISTGHKRYFIVGYILLGLLGIDTILLLITNSKRVLFYVTYALSATGILILLIQPAFLMYKIGTGYEWSWRNSFDRQNISENISYVFRDKNTAITTPVADTILSCWGARGGIANIIYPDATSIMRGYLSSITSETEQDYWIKKIHKQFSEGSVYDLLSPALSNIDFKEYGKRLDEYGLSLKDIAWPDSIFRRNDALCLITLEESDIDNTILYANVSDDYYELPCSKGTLTATLTLDRTLGWYTDDITYFTVTLYTNDSSVPTILQKDILHESEVYTLNLDLDLNNSQSAYVSFSWTDENDNEFINSPYKCVIINPEFQCN